jgi:lysophospholipase L1-like esterase
VRRLAGQRQQYATEFGPNMTSYVAIIKVAAEQGVPVLDLNAISHAAVAAMGQPAADTLAEAPPRFDRTHLGPRGAALFSEQVLEGLVKIKPDLAGVKTLVP